MRNALLTTALLLATAALPAQAERLKVVELFTSQGCSSCPPADALLAELSQARGDVLALGFHVTYWDRLGWKDPYSLPEATARQRAAATRLGIDYVYTPQLVVNGQFQAIGSDRAAVAAALDQAATGAAQAPDVTIAERGGKLQVGVGAAPDGKAATVLLVGFDPAHDTAVGRGENAGHTLREVNVVRGLTTAGRWQGAAIALQAARPPGQRVAALLQGDDGAIIGAALLP